MSPAQGRCDVNRDLENLVNGQPTFSIEQNPQTIAFDIGHDVPQKLTRAPRVQQRKNVRMGKAADDLDLAQEPLCSQTTCNLGPEYLDRYLAVMPAIRGYIHSRHTTAPDLPLHCINVWQRADKILEQIGHRAS
jgi:hypothetical protein